MKSEETVELAIEYWLMRVDGVGPKTMDKIEERVGGRFARLADESTASLESLLEEASVPSNIRARITPPRLQEAFDGWESVLASVPADGRILHRKAPAYPHRLSILESPPRFLFARGSTEVLSTASTVAIVGSRDATVDAVRQTREIAGVLGRAGVPVVSGGAIGVDAAAHEGALDGEGQTVVVLPGGVDSPRPAKNARIFRRALQDGCLLSEYPPGTTVRKYHFHRRNRLIAALGDRILVVRAARKSGTMITARAAAELGRPILAIPGPVDDGRFGGCVDLLAAGATCVRHGGDVLDALETETQPRDSVDLERMSETRSSGSRSPRNSESRKDPELRARLGEEARDVLEWMDDRDSSSIFVDVIRRESTIGCAGVETALLELELAGVIEKVPGKNAYTIVK